MEFQLIRNATVKLNYGGKIILIDPMLCKKNTFPPFVKGLLPNPIIDLNLSVSEILSDIDCVLVTHSHPDHFDDLSCELLPEGIQLICTPADENFDKFDKFKHKEVVKDEIIWEGITITRIEGEHGSGPVLPYMGKVSGFILQAPKEPSVYIVSDSIWCDKVETAIQSFKPEIIIANSGGGVIPGFDAYPVMLNEEQTVSLIHASKGSKVIAVHLESIDFCKVTRKSLREFANNNEVSEQQLIIPFDGEKLSFH